MPRVYRPLGALLATIALGGCAGAPDSLRDITVSPGVRIATSDIIVTGPSIEHFETRDLDTDESTGRSVHETTAPDARGAWTMTESAEGEPPRETGYRLDPEGALLLEWSRSPKDTDPDGPARLFVFDPPLVLFPPVLESGVPFEHRTRMTERHPKDETRVVLSGSARRRVQLAGFEATDQSDEPAVRINADLRIGVGPADVTRLTTLVYHPNHGLMSELIDYSIRVLGLRFKHKRTMLIRRDLQPRFDGSRVDNPRP